MNANKISLIIVLIISLIFILSSNTNAFKKRLRPGLGLGRGLIRASLPNLSILGIKKNADIVSNRDNAPSTLNSNLIKTDANVRRQNEIKPDANVRRQNETKPDANVRRQNEIKTDAKLSKSTANARRQDEVARCLVKLNWLKKLFARAGFYNKLAQSRSNFLSKLHALIRLQTPFKFQTPTSVIESRQSRQAATTGVIASAIAYGMASLPFLIFPLFLMTALPVANRVMPLVTGVDEALESTKGSPIQEILSAVGMTAPNLSALAENPSKIAAALGLNPVTLEEEPSKLMSSAAANAIGDAIFSPGLFNPNSGLFNPTKNSGKYKPYIYTKGPINDSEKYAITSGASSIAEKLASASNASSLISKSPLKSIKEKISESIKTVENNSVETPLNSPLASILASSASASSSPLASLLLASPETTTQTPASFLASLTRVIQALTSSTNVVSSMRQAVHPLSSVRSHLSSLGQSAVSGIKKAAVASVRGRSESILSVAKDVGKTVIDGAKKYELSKDECRERLVCEVSAKYAGASFKSWATALMEVLELDAAIEKKVAEKGSVLLRNVYRGARSALKDNVNCADLFPNCPT